MRIKHFAGYGSVNAKKISRKEKNGLVNLQVQVRGNHEWGIERNDKYDFVNWLGKRFDKELDDYRKILNFRTESYWDEKEHEDVCNYYVTYEKAV